MDVIDDLSDFESSSESGDIKITKRTRKKPEIFSPTFKRPSKKSRGKTRKRVSENTRNSKKRKKCHKNSTKKNNEKLIEASELFGKYFKKYFLKKIKTLDLTSDRALKRTKLLLDIFKKNGDIKMHLDTDQNYLVQSSDGKTTYKITPRQVIHDKIENKSRVYNCCNCNERFGDPQKRRSCKHCAKLIFDNFDSFIHDFITRVKREVFKISPTGDLKDFEDLGKKIKQIEITTK